MEYRRAGPSADAAGQVVEMFALDTRHELPAPGREERPSPHPGRDPGTIRPVGSDIEPAIGEGMHEVDAARLRAAMGMVAAWVEEGVVPGAALMVGRGGTVIAEGYWGMADA